MKLLKMVLIAVVAIAITACSSDGGNKQTIGAVAGAVGGAVIGAQFGGGTGKVLMGAVGAGAGALAGSYIGKSMDDQDKAAAKGK